MRTRGTLTHLALALAVVVPLAACDRGPSPEVQRQIDNLQAVRDSLTQELAQQTASIQRLSRSIEQASGEVSGSGVTAPEELRDRITAMAEELDQARSQLADARQRIAVLSRRSGNLRDSLSAAITERDRALAMQRDSITGLTDQLSQMASRAEELTSVRSELSDKLSTLERKYYTAYYRVGTEQELLSDGLVEKEGGARVLFVLWKRGQTLVPTRGLAPDDFNAIDLRQVDAIRLPAAGEYRILSRQATEYLDPQPDAEGRFNADTLRITNPEAFWQQSRFLIVVNEATE